MNSAAASPDPIEELLDAGDKSLTASEFLAWLLDKFASGTREHNRVDAHVPFYRVFEICVPYGPFRPEAIRNYIREGRFTAYKVDGTTVIICARSFDAWLERSSIKIEPVMKPRS
jgi:hypothetical protein